MSVAMGLEPVRTVVAAQKCQVMYEEKMETIWSWKWIFMCACVMVFFLLSTWFGVRRILKLESRMLQNEQEMRSVQQQLADHYDYAAELGTRAEHVDETVDGLAVRLVAVEEEHQEATVVWEDAVDCLRYGLMELGGFVRFSRLSRDQRSHMLSQERGNFVVWSIRNRADTTDPDTHAPEEYRDDDGENGEEEPRTEDEHVNDPQPHGAERLLSNMREDQNTALSGQRYSEANNIQNAIITLLDATSGPNPEGLTMTVITEIRNVFQRLWRWHRNRGSDERAERFRLYVQDMQQLMR